MRARDGRTSQRRKRTATWPINPSAAAPPQITRRLGALPIISSTRCIEECRVRSNGMRLSGGAELEYSQMQFYNRRRAPPASGMLGGIPTNSRYRGTASRSYVATVVSQSRDRHRHDPGSEPQAAAADETKTCKYARTALYNPSSSASATNAWPIDTTQMSGMRENRPRF